MKLPKSLFWRLIQKVRYWSSEAVFLTILQCIWGGLFENSIVLCCVCSPLSSTLTLLYFCKSLLLTILNLKKQLELKCFCDNSVRQFWPNLTESNYSEISWIWSMWWAQSCNTYCTVCSNSTWITCKKAPVFSYNGRTPTTQGHVLLGIPIMQWILYKCLLKWRSWSSWKILKLFLNDHVKVTFENELFH